MEIRCPACRKINLSTDECVRCGCELMSLKKIIHLSAVFSKKSLHALSKLKYQEALSLAQQSWQLRNTSSAARLAFLASLGIGCEPKARIWYNRGLKFGRITGFHS